MESNVKSTYSITTDSGRTYTQAEIEKMIEAHEMWKDISEKLRMEVNEEMYGERACFNVCEDVEPNYYNCRPVRKKRYSITINQAADFVEEYGAYEFALFVSLMFHRTLGDMISKNGAERLGQTVRNMRSKRIVAVSVNGDLYDIHDNDNASFNFGNN